MGLLLSERELAELEPAEKAAFHSPVPTQIVSKGEFVPLPQTSQQRKVEARIKELADTAASRLGMNRRQFLRATSDMATAFIAMNEVFGMVNKLAGSRRLLFHSVITPGQPGWMDEVERYISEVKPSSWKGYVGLRPM
jgi:hypothetical protein